MPEKLIFIDTNIFLDFYRSQTDAGLSLLRRAEGIPDKLITTFQVEMEFKKNRQEVIVESINALKPPTDIARPAIFSDAKTFQLLQRDISNAKKRVARLKHSLKQALAKPTTHDQVYRIVQRLLTNETNFNLAQNNKERFRIRRKALRRFLLGHPPRKKNDTSIGDAINWEWIVHCAQNSNAEIIIVSRDSDYGVTLEKESFLNDSLAQEFRSRVSRKRKIRLCTRLSEALKLFAVKVTEAEAKEEESIAKPTASTLSPEQINEFMNYYRDNPDNYIIPPMRPHMAGLGISGLFTATSEDNQGNQ
ncbi:MAG: PIN domain-containing protein [Verrucomicrobiales bacterium]|nr:PIN domain-containing protein [Verrucomicrobiales bacterium]